MRKKRSEKIVNAICMLIIAVFVVFIGIRICRMFFLSAHIPTNSMTPTLLPGDNIIVEKDHGISFKRGEIALFVLPEPDGNFYMKRIYGMPGDTLSIENFRYVVNGMDSITGNEERIREIRDLFASRDVMDSVRRAEIYMRTFATDSAHPWTIRDFGPVIMPVAGMKMTVTEDFIRKYRQAVKYETGKDLAVDSAGRIFLGGEPIYCYRFKESYYFMGGDNVGNSRDSRYLGLIPESCVKGKGLFIWKSVNDNTGRKRWDRFLKRPWMEKE